MLRRNLRPASTMILIMTVVTGLGYSLAMTAVAQLAAPHQANGSLIERDGTVVGSALVGQAFESPRYLAPRPSAVDYAADNSGASNLGATSRELVTAIRGRAEAAAERFGAERPPVDLVTASASGLDPHLSPEAALIQADAIAAARGVDAAAVTRVIEAHVRQPVFGVIGEPRVDVLAVNLALDDAFGR
ncbi:MAG: potassium-transporting ATPase subunit KdpC [Paracoccaceae bacterium]